MLSFTHSSLHVYIIVRTVKYHTPLVAFKSNQHNHHHPRYNPLHDDCCSYHHLFSTGSTCCCYFCPLAVIAVVVILGTPFHRFIPVSIPAANLDDPAVISLNSVRVRRGGVCGTTIGDPTDEAAILPSLLLLKWQQHCLPYYF